MNTNTESDRTAAYTRIVEQWNAAGYAPRGLREVSHSDFIAVCLAAGRPHLVPDPLRDFLALDAHMQRWVLEQLGMAHCIGQALGR